MRLGSKKAIHPKAIRGAAMQAVQREGAASCELRAALCALLPLLNINNMRFSWS
jgi:hypothetical protein